MTPRELILSLALVALAEPEPDYAEHPHEWQLWHDVRMSSLVYAAEVKKRLADEAEH